MGEYWIITNEQQSFQLSNHLYSKQWEKNTPCSTKAIVLLELIEVLYNKGKHIESGLIKVFINNRYNNKRLTEEMIKLNTFAKKQEQKLLK